MEPNSFKKFKEKIKVFAHSSDFFFFKISQHKPSKPGHGNLVLIVSIVQVEHQS